MREVSVEKGYDPRDFALVASGGAGPLHVMAIARELHVPKVIVPLFPSHFSALGMLLADERHDFIRTHYADLGRLDFAALNAIHDEMVAEAEGQLRQKRGARHQVHLDLRYVGQEFTLSVPVTLAQLRAADRPAIRAAFDALYEQRYAHHSPEEPVEIVNIRLAAIGQRPRLSFPSLAPGAAPVAETRRAVYLGGKDAVAMPRLSPRRSRRRGEDRRAGDRPGARHDDRALRRRPLPGGAVGRAHRRGRRRMMDAQLDTVTLEVIRNALPAIANEMAADLQRTSYNMMIYEVRDFCTALVRPDGALVSQNVGGVSHFVADLGVIITDGMKRYGAEGFKPGDVLITNHQAVAGQHLNNIVIYTPYFFEGELLMFAIVRAHWIDVGGWSTGFGAGPHVPDPWLEGLQLEPAQDLPRRRARRDALPRHLRQHPLPEIVAWAT